MIAIKKNIGTAAAIIFILVLSCSIMYFVEMSAGEYFIKSLWKIGAFLVLPMVYSGLNKNISFKDFFLIKSKKQILQSLVLGVGVYIFILCGYYLLKDFIDLTRIAGLLTESTKVNKENFLFVALYISFINSLLEEFFFRGFAFLSLSKRLTPFTAYFISALAFSLYHVAILAQWFNIWLFILIIVGLFVSGIFFNWLNEKNNNIYNSWLVHMFANFGINTIGFIMFWQL